MNGNSPSERLELVGDAVVAGVEVATATSKSPFRVYVPPMVMSEIIGVAPGAEVGSVITVEYPRGSHADSCAKSVGPT